MNDLESIASTILDYEDNRRRNTGPTDQRLTLARDSAEVLATGVPNPKIATTLNMKLGANPADLRSMPYVQGHPLEFAAAFQDDIPLRDRFLWVLERDIQHEMETGTGSYASYWSEAIQIPGPDDEGCRLKVGRPRLFHPFHAAWYEPQALYRLADDSLKHQTGVGTFLATCSGALQRARQPLNTLVHTATKMVKRELEKRANQNTDYVGIAEAIALADQDTVEAEIKKCNGVYAILGITLRNPSEDTMVRGLKAMAGHTRLELLKLMHRSPTITEIQRSNVKGAARIWRLMPYALLRPLVSDDSTGQLMQAALVRRTEELSLEEMRTVFVDHAERVVLTPAPAERTGKGATFDVFRAGLHRYYRANALRETLLATYPTDVVRLIALRVLGGRADLSKYVDHELTEPAGQAIAAYENPLTQIGEFYKEVM